MKNDNNFYRQSPFSFRFINLNQINISKWLLFRLSVICVLFLMVQILFTACNYNVDSISPETSYKPSISLPLGVFTISPDDLIENSNLKPVLPDTFSVPANLFELYGLVYKTPVDYDTIIRRDFSLSDLTDYMDDVTQLMFRVNSINSSHADIALQVYFLDDYQRIVDSIFAKGALWIPAGSVKADGTISPAKQWRQDEYFSQQRILDVVNTTRLQIVVKFKFPTKGEQVRFDETKLLWIQLALRGGVDLDVNEFM